MNFLRELVFKYTNFMSTKHRSPTCGYFAVVASISCSLKLFSNLSATPFQKATFPSAFQVPKLFQTPMPFQTATFSAPVKKLVCVKPRLRCKWRLFSAFQTARQIQAPKLFQVTITNDWLKPDSLSNCDQYWQQRSANTRRAGFNR